MKTRIAHTLRTATSLAGFRAAMLAAAAGGATALLAGALLALTHNPPSEWLPPPFPNAVPLSR